MSSKTELKRGATLSMILEADSGYSSAENHRITVDQWERIVRIVNETPEEAK